MKNHIQEKVASQDISLLHIGRVRRDWSAQDAKDLLLPDGHRDAVRVRVNAETGALIEANGRIGICAPWLLADVFSVKRK